MKRRTLWTLPVAVIGVAAPLASASPARCTVEVRGLCKGETKCGKTTYKGTLVITTSQPGTFEITSLSPSTWLGISPNGPQALASGVSTLQGEFTVPVGDTNPVGMITYTLHGIAGSLALDISKVPSCRNC